MALEELRAIHGQERNAPRIQLTCAEGDSLVAIWSAEAIASALKFARLARRGNHNARTLQVSRLRFAERARASLTLTVPPLRLMKAVIDRTVCDRKRTIPWVMIDGGPSSISRGWCPR